MRDRRRRASRARFRHARQESKNARPLVRDVWRELGNLRDRLREIASGKDEDRRLALLLKRFGPKLCFRTTVVVDAQFRKTALDRVRASG